MKFRAFELTFNWKMNQLRVQSNLSFCNYELLPVQGLCLRETTVSRVKGKLRLCSFISRLDLSQKSALQSAFLSKSPTFTPFMIVPLMRDLVYSKFYLLLEIFCDLTKRNPFPVMLFTRITRPCKGPLRLVIDLYLLKGQKCTLLAKKSFLALSLVLSACFFHYNRSLSSSSSSSMWQFESPFSDILCHISVQTWSFLHISFRTLLSTQWRCVCLHTSSCLFQFLENFLWLYKFVDCLWVKNTYLQMNLSGSFPSVQ